MVQLLDERGGPTPDPALQPDVGNLIFSFPDDGPDTLIGIEFACGGTNVSKHVPAHLPEVGS